MQNFADQCLDMARSILEQNFPAIKDDGAVSPMDGESQNPDDSGHAALAIGEFYRATQETQLGNFDLVDLAARCITAQVFSEEENENGLAYCALGLLSFGPAKDRNAVWERLMDPTRERLDERLSKQSDSNDHAQAFNVAKAVTRFSLGFSRKDETGKLIDRFVEGIGANSSAGFHDDAPEEGVGGAYNIYGVLSFIFIRQALQLHANVHLRERKLPTLRTNAEKYIRMMPDLVRQDGLGWAFGSGIGAYGQMHCITIILQAMRDGWIGEERKPLYLDILRRLFQFFFMTYLDQEQGYLVIRDAQRSTVPAHTTRSANFDGARYLCQWSRLSRAIGGSMMSGSTPSKRSGRFVIFDKTNRKEQGLFIYRDPDSGLHIQLPLVGSTKPHCSDSLAFPHSPGVFDWPVNVYMPLLVPELTIGDNVFIPCFYGRHCVIGLGLRNSFYFRYEQPELITREGKIVTGVGNVKVAWTFVGNKVTGDFIYTVKNKVQLDLMRFMLAIGAPHSSFRTGMTFTLGRDGLRCSVLKDDFQGIWQETEPVTNDPAYRSYFGNIHFIQTLLRDHPLIMRPGQQYRLTVTFEPDITFAE